MGPEGCNVSICPSIAFDCAFLRGAPDLKQCAGAAAVTDPEMALLNAARERISAGILQKPAPVATPARTAMRQAHKLANALLSKVMLTTLSGTGRQPQKACL